MASSSSGENTDPTGKALHSGFNPFLHRIFTLFNLFDIVNMRSDAIANAGGGQSHSNISPFLTIKCLINLVGLSGGSAPEPFMGEIRWVAYNAPAPNGWADCSGQLLPINQNQELFSILGTIYGGDGRTSFGLPDMRGRMPMDDGAGHPLGQRSGQENVALDINEMPVHTNQLRGTTAIGSNVIPTIQLLAQGPHPLANRIYQDSNLDQNMASESVSNTGGGQGHQNMPPFLTIKCIIALQGTVPPRTGGGITNAYIGEIRWFAGNFAPSGYADCSGQLLQVEENTALFSLLGTTYGGDGRTTFGLPNMEGRMPLHDGRGPGLTQYRLGQVGGTETVTLSQNQMASHNHILQAMNSDSTTTSPMGNMLGLGLSSNYHNIYGTGTLTDMHPDAIANAGGGQPHDNMPPHLVIKCLIALRGVFPSQS
jgi:microcystin-dependent protein